jgi:hypothetical protein
LLATEGDDASFDRAFYNWILGASIAQSSVGSCDTVRAAVKQLGVWKLENVRTCGIVDRDYRTDEKLNNFEEDRCIVLPYHEAESYLCHPDVAVDASTLSGKAVSRDQVTEMLAHSCDRHLLRTALRRTIELSEIRLAVGKGEDEAWPKDFDAALEALRQWVKQELPRAGGLESKVEHDFRDEYAKARKAIEDRNVEEMLRIFPGKSLAQAMAKPLGFQSHALMLNALRANRRANSYQPLVEIRKKVEAMIGLPT